MPVVIKVEFKYKTKASVEPGKEGLCMFSFAANPNADLGLQALRQRCLDYAKQYLGIDSSTIEIKYMSFD